MDQLIGIILLVASGIVTVVALLAAIGLLLPNPVGRVQKNLEDSLGRSTLLGLVNFLFFGAIFMLAIWLSERIGNIIAGIFVFLAGLIGIGMIVLAVFGLVAFAKLLGERIGVETNSPFKANLRGGLLLILAAIAPYVGWLIFTPLVIWAGLGAAISAFFRRGGQSYSGEEAS